MPITINTNISAMISQRNLASASNRSASSLAKLSSGSRVPTAKEDAASLAIGTGLKVDVSALKAAQVNAQQGASLLQVADGAFGQVSDILTRMKSLSTTAQSGQLSSVERGFLNQEYGLLAEEVDRIAATTEFNGQQLLGGSNTLTSVFAETGSGGSATSIQSDSGFVAYEFDAGSANAGDRFALFYDDSTGNITVNNGTQGQAQTINLGDPAAGVKAVDVGETRQLDFSNIGVKITINADFLAGADIGAGVGTASDIGTVAGLDAVLAPDPTVVFGAALGDSTSPFSADFQVGINSTPNDRITVAIAVGNFDGLANNGGTRADLTTTAQAATASAQVDSAVSGTTGINQARASIGANLNKLDFANSNLSVTIENTEAARSVLMDVDVSAEITKFTSEQVLIQAGVSMLAQANQQPSLLLRLLQ